MNYVIDIVDAESFEEVSSSFQRSDYPTLDALLKALREQLEELDILENDEDELPEGGDGFSY